MKYLIGKEKHNTIEDKMTRMVMSSRKPVPVISSGSPWADIPNSYSQRGQFIILSLHSMIHRYLSPWTCIYHHFMLLTYCFCSVSYYYYYYYSLYSLSPFFLWHMNLSTTDLRNYRTEFHETWWSYRYMFLVGPKVFSFVVKGVKVIFWGVQRGWGLL